MPAPQQQKTPAPRHAASLVIYREGTGGTEIVMGRRSDQARFKPGIYVFPGGMIERWDHFARPATPLAATITHKLAVGGSQRRANALAMAAIRETYEESGLIVGVPGDIGSNPHPSWQKIRDRGLAPALDRLTYLGRAITPSHSQIRFHARFFGVDARDIQGELRNTSELLDLQWVPVSAAKELPLMNVTLMILDSLQTYLTAAEHRAPFLSFQRGRRLIQWS